MKRLFLFVIISSAFLIGARGQTTSDELARARGQATSDALARRGEMRILFHGFDEVTNPEMRLKEAVFLISFVDLPIPGGPLLLRRGDRVAGYTIGHFVKREPVILPTDGIKPGTKSTLEVIHVESGEKYVLEPDRLRVVRRDPIHRR